MLGQGGKDNSARLGHNDPVVYRIGYRVLSAETVVRIHPGSTGLLTVQKG